VISRQLVDGWYKYKLAVPIAYKRDSNSRVRRGETSLWLSPQDYLCKCPKVKLHQKYLLMGKKGSVENYMSVITVLTTLNYYLL